MNKHELLANILLEVYRTIDFSRIPQSLKMKFWSWFENRIKSASLTTSVERFLEQFCKISHYEVSEKMFQYIQEAKSKYTDEELLDILRCETKYVVLYMRDINEKRKGGK